MPSSRPSRRYHPKYRPFLWSKPLKSPARSPLNGLGLLRQTYLTLKAGRWWFVVLGLALLAGLLGLAYYYDLLVDLESRQVALDLELADDWQTTLASGLSLVFEALSEALVWNQDGLLRLWLFWGLAFGSLLSLSLVRSLKSKTRTDWRQILYFGPAQIMPFLILVVFLIIQALPFLIVLGVANSLRLNEVVVTNLEQAAILGVVGVIGWLSAFWVTGSLLSLVIVSLPGARPGQAWQTALAVARYRRWLICRRLIWLVLALSGLGLLLLLPFALWLITGLIYALYVFLISAFIVSHVYIYELYRELIKND